MDGSRILKIENGSPWTVHFNPRPSTLDMTLPSKSSFTKPWSEVKSVKAVDVQKNVIIWMWIYMTTVSHDQHHYHQRRQRVEDRQFESQGHCHQLWLDVNLEDILLYLISISRIKLFQFYSFEQFNNWVFVNFSFLFLNIFTEGLKHGHGGRAPSQSKSTDGSFIWVA